MKFLSRLNQKVICCQHKMRHREAQKCQVAFVSTNEKVNVIICQVEMKNQRKTKKKSTGGKKIKLLKTFQDETNAYQRTAV